VFRFQLRFPLPAHCKIKPLVKLHRSPDCMWVKTICKTMTIFYKSYIFDIF
ncbi:hypothetical protein GOODEAATRI_009232, partial [Goodea atripinnis]